MKNLSLTLCIQLIIVLFFGCQTEDYYQADDYAKVPKIDVHVHVRTERDNFARQAEKDNFRLVNIVVDGAGTWDRIYEQFSYSMFQQQAHPEVYRTLTSFSVEGFHEPGWDDKVTQWMDSCFCTRRDRGQSLEEHRNGA